MPPLSSLKLTLMSEVLVIEVPTVLECTRKVPRAFASMLMLLTRWLAMLPAGKLGRQYGCLRFLEASMRAGHSSIIPRARSRVLRRCSAIYSTYRDIDVGNIILYKELERQLLIVRLHQSWRRHFSMLEWKDVHNHAF